MLKFHPAALGSERLREHGEDVLAVLATALHAVDPAEAIRRHVTREGGKLSVGERWYDLSKYESVYVIGGGKASGAMCVAVEDILGERISAGLINVKYGYTAPTRVVEINEAGHPIPDESGTRGAARMVQLARKAGPRDLVMCLISGGGSALMSLPVDGVSLQDLQTMTDALLRCGATIVEINAIRKHLSQIKGGNLARWAYPAEVVSLILSDVVGNPLDVIASGPTVPDNGTFTDALEVIERYGLMGQLPHSILGYLQRGVEGELPETLKQGDPVFDRVNNLVVASNDIAASAAVLKARELGYHAMLLSTYIEGEAREVGRVFAAIGREIAASERPIAPPACIVAGGETTVTVLGDGLGGRNQELALAVALGIEGLENVLVVALATDGTDGPTDASGAVVDGTTLARANAKGLSPVRFLRNNDAYHFFELLGDLLITGPTNTNVNDLTFVFVFE